ncbi:GNAT family N-acetyltransferase [Tautonia plasticadhaerens]|uniref:Putative N-acetyltransferase YafP n=1 Tax=Tautonia plasticadhaerens TaxID=2527974 RepID=A0A518H0G5_9BACT|nr:GNAT family N-acetyltransferase [Tautonia plasticadhaerens]QDV34336.1 putative N-acetyltransferase YafP [Tautonia plasticadhaerens]
MVRIRPYRPEDAPALLDLFRDTIRRVNARDYGPEQIRAWASDEIDPGAWASRFSGRFVAVAEVEGRLAGFAELEPDGHIDRFYVSADHQGMGVGSGLMEVVEEEARRLGIAELSAEASLTARPFFERRGFEVRSPQEVVLRGVSFRNFRMSKRPEG